MTPSALSHSATTDSAPKQPTLPEPPSEFELEKTLAEELQKLSFKERVEIEEEVHGVRCGAVEETEELICTSLRELDVLLNAQKENSQHSHLLQNVVRISLLNKTEAHAAKTKCYLNDPDVRLRFLRCETFCVQEAVERFLKFLEFTFQLFGDFVKDRPISLRDFTSQEQKAMQNSRAQYLRFRDRSGRRVFAVVGSCNYEYPNNLRYKILMYLHWVVSEDIETQRKGMVTICWLFDEDGRPEVAWEKLRHSMAPDENKWSSLYDDSRPIRLCGLHQYFPQDTLFFRLLANLYVFTIRPKERKFYKYFFGDQTELLYKSNSFGVSSDMIPVSNTLKVKTQNHKTWFHFQREKEHEQCTNSSNTMDEIIECPGSHDVVFKKGPCHRSNPGNMRFRSLIEEIADEHHLASTNDEKMQLTIRVVQQVEKEGGRFLDSWNGKMWTLAEDRNKVRTRVAAAIKQYNRQRAAAASEQLSLQRAIQDGNAILGTASEDKKENNNIIKQAGLVRDIRHSFMDYERFSKRPKLQGCFGGIDSDKSCFAGKSFFCTG